MKVRRGEKRRNIPRLSCGAHGICRVHKPSSVAKRAGPITQGGIRATTALENERPNGYGRGKHEMAVAFFSLVMHDRL